jgi:hypothetical protein
VSKAVGEKGLNLPKESLLGGNVGTIVHIHKGGAAYEVEFFTLTGGSSYFSDPDWTNYPGRFYRLRSR